MPIETHDPDAEKLAPSFRTVLRLVNEHYPPIPIDTQEADNPLAAISQCVIYTRLSKDDDKSHSPATQLFICKETAMRQKWTVLKTITRDADEPISGKAFEGRPGWDAVTAYVKSMKEPERAKTCVLVKDFSRFSRNLEEGLATERVFRSELSVRLRACDTLYLAPELPEGWMTFVDLLKFAHFEREQIVKRTKQGLATARREGKHLGHFPKHFTTDGEGRIVPTPQAVEVAQMRANNKSYVEIARRTGVSRHAAFAICTFLASERQRLES